MNTHAIGIDFGTSKTLVSHINPQTGHPETIRLGRGGDLIPTTIFIDSAGRFSFGDDADDLIEDISGTYLRGFKMQLGSDTPVHMYLAPNGDFRQLTAKDLVKEYLLYIRQQVEKLVYQGERVTAATITRPVNFSPAQCQELQQAALAAGFEHVEFTTEPEAAGLAFCRLNAADSFKKSALIVDWGGGTLDLALITRQHNRVCTHPSLIDGAMGIGGEKFDEKLWQYVTHELEKQGDYTLNHVLMLPKVRSAKEQLSSRASIKLRLSYANGVCPPLDLTRSSFNELIIEDVQKAGTIVQRLLNRIPAELKPEMLLLVGGSCQIPLIKEQLEKACGLPAFSWHYAREAVALGAALWGVSSALEQEPDTKPQECNSQNTKSGVSDLILFDAIINGDKRMVSKALASGANVQAKGQDGITPLLLATQHKQAGVVQMLLEAGANPLEKDANDQTLLEIAARNGDEETLGHLLAASPGNNQKLEAISSALRLAGSNKNPNVCPLLEKSKAEVTLSLLNIRKENYDAELSMAIQEESRHTIRLLLLAGADVNKKNAAGDTPLIQATLQNSASVIDELLKAGADIAERNAADLTALDIAIKRNDIKLAEKFISLCKIEAGNLPVLTSAWQHAHNMGVTDLIAKLRKLRCCLSLKQMGIYKDSFNDELIKAARNNDIRKMELLLSAGADCNYYSADAAHTVLTISICNGSYNCFRKLLQEPDIKVNLATEKGYTPLMYAADFGQEACLHDLLKASAAMDLRDNETGMTALMHAVAGGRPDCVKILLQQDKNTLNTVDNSGKTALMHASIHQQEACMKVMLTVPDIDLDIESDEKMDALQYAACHNAPSCMRLLIQHKKNYGLQSKTAKAKYAGDLVNAARQGNVQVLSLLIEAGATNYAEAMREAIVHHDDASVIQVLLSAGVDINQALSTGETPLHSAAAAGRLQMVKFISSQPGVNINSTLYKGISPLVTAVDNKCADCATVILSKGGKVIFPDKHTLTARDWFMGTICFIFFGLIFLIGETDERWLFIMPMVMVILGTASIAWDNRKARKVKEKKYMDYIRKNQRSVKTNATPKSTKKSPTEPIRINQRSVKTNATPKSAKKSPTVPIRKNQR